MADSAAAEEISMHPHTAEAAAAHVIAADKTYDQNPAPDRSANGRRIVSCIG